MVVVYSILQHAVELLEVGDKAIHLSNFFESDNVSDRTAEATVINVIDELDGDDETGSEAASVQLLPGYLYPLLREIENVSHTHQYSRQFCPGKALFSEVGNRLKKVHACSREQMWKEMKLKALREELINQVWLDSNFEITSDPKASNIQKQLYFLCLTEKGRDYLNEARPRHDD